MRPQKKIHKIRLTVGGDRLDYHVDPSAPVVGLLDTKTYLIVSSQMPITALDTMLSILRNIISTIACSNFNIYAYIKNTSLQNFCNEYNIAHFTEKDGYVYCEIRKGMYGLKEARIIAYQDLVKNLAMYGYELMQCTLGLWHHKTRQTTFTLAVDDFGINVSNPVDLYHNYHHYKSTTP